MKKKIRTDGVEELFEIVRAIQNGEEPDEAVQKKRDERAEAARLEAQKQQEAARIEAQEREEAAREEKRKREEAAREEKKKREEAALARKLRREEKARQRKKNAEQSAEEDGAYEEEEIDEESEQSGIGVFLRKSVQAFGESWKERRQKRKDAFADEEEADEEFADDDSFEDSEAVSQESDDSNVAVEQLSQGTKKDAGAVPDVAETQKESEPPQKSGKDMQTQEKADVRTGQEPEEEQELTHKGWILEEDMMAAVAADRRAPIKEPEADDGAPVHNFADRPEKSPTDKQARKLAKLSLHGVKERAETLKEDLLQKGFGKKELAMLGVGLVLAVLIITLITNAISDSIERKKKMEHVTADKGLSVMVEDEPEKWCSSYPVVLQIRAKGGQPEQVEINKETYDLDEKGMVTVQASDYLLELTAKVGEETLTAQIEIPKIDSQTPVVTVSREENTIVVSGADNRSEIAQLWYAVVREEDYLEIPLYKKYTAPLTFESDTMYYFYAQDKAGNKSTPLVTTMELPHSAALVNKELSLFPGETSYLELQAEPEGALLNNLKYESANPEIAVADAKGAVTAIAEGSTIIHVSADGIEELDCPVTVSSARTVTISALGDCTLGSDSSFNTTTNFDAFAAVNGTSYFFANVKDILENDDATFANFEGTLTTEDTRESKQYAFKGDPSYTEVLTNGSVDVVTLANNHSSDYGVQSNEDTKQYLEGAGIDYCTGDEIVVKDVNGIRTAFIGIYVLDEGLAKEEQVKETIAAAKSQGAQLVIMAFHWGTEKATEPDATQITLAHAAVDAGADLVVGHHPHVLQGIEKYNGKYIAYSLGNFCFGGNSTPSDMDTIIFRQTFRVTEDGVEPDAETEIIPCSISSVEGYNNYQPTPAQGSEADRIIEKLNECSSAYGQTFTASTGLE